MRRYTPSSSSTRKLLVKDCFFCHSPSHSLPPSQHNKWICHACGLCNGFTENGDFHPSPQAPSGSTVARKGSFSHRKSFLCPTCQHNRQLVINLRARFVPKVEDNYNEEATKYMDDVEKRYPLCQSCQQEVEDRLQDVDRFVAQTYLSQSLRRSKKADISELRPTVDMATLFVHQLYRLAMIYIVPYVEGTGTFNIMPDGVIQWLQAPFQVPLSIGWPTVVNSLHILLQAMLAFHDTSILVHARPFPARQVFSGGYTLQGVALLFCGIASMYPSQVASWIRISIQAWGDDVVTTEWIVTGVILFSVIWFALLAILHWATAFWFATPTSKVDLGLKLSPKHPSPKKSRPRNRDEPLFTSGTKPSQQDPFPSFDLQPDLGAVADVSAMMESVRLNDKPTSAWDLLFAKISSAKSHMGLFWSQYIQRAILAVLPAIVLVAAMRVIFRDLPVI